MKKLYLISAVAVSILILIVAAAQFGATCTWYLLPPNSNPVFVLLQNSALGAVVGGLLVLWWTAPTQTDDEDGMDDEVSDSGSDE